MPKIILYKKSKKVFFTIFQSLSIILFVSSFSFINQTLNSDNINEEDLELIFVYQHVRHGVRGPSSSYNSLFKDGVDEFGVSWEGEGDGELTLVGKRQHYDLGVRNRIRYGTGENGLGLIDFSKYNTEEVLFHVTDYNRTHQSLNSQLLGMYKPGILKSLNPEEVQGSFPPNAEKWFSSSKPIYSEILEEINSLENQTIIDSIPIFNVHPFGENRIFNLENNCKNLDNLREESLKGKDDLLYGYFLEHKEKLKEFFGFKDYSYFTNIRMMNSITDHYLSDYKSFKNLSMFQEITGIKLEEFYEKSTKFYYDWLYNYYCTNKTCMMESSRLMEDLLGYMERRKKYHPNITYYAPKLVIDCGHDTTVGPMQMFMYEAWKHKPEYGVITKYCGFASNIYFELYKTKEGTNHYYVFYYIDEELIHIFDYDEFIETIRSRIYTQENITKYCMTDEEKEKEKEEENKDKEEKKCKYEKESFSESFKHHKGLWISLFVFIFTTILGIIGIAYLFLKIRHSQKLSGKINTTGEANMKLMESLE